MNAIADREDFIVVYPQGTNNFWNDGRERAPQADDVGFIRLLIAHLEKTLNVDSRRIYAAGISNGGMFTQRLACELGDKIAAMASVAASMPENYSVRCRPTDAISVLMIHGTDDPLVPYRGGALPPASNIGGKVWPVADTIKYWAAHDKCSDKPNINYLPDKDSQDRTVTRHEEYVGCFRGTDVVLYVVEGGGHTWPGANQYLPERVVGTTARDFDGSEVIWDFFKHHSKK
jgi:polyhydroxybutyrate depolymerase